MTYHAGIGMGMRALGFEPCDPYVTCDGCGVTNWGINYDGMTAAWLRNGTAPKG